MLKVFVVALVAYQYFFLVEAAPRIDSAEAENTFSSNFKIKEKIIINKLTIFFF